MPESGALSVPVPVTEAQAVDRTSKSDCYLANLLPPRFYGLYMRSAVVPIAGVLKHSCVYPGPDCSGAV